MPIIFFCNPWQQLLNQFIELVGHNCMFVESSHLPPHYVLPIVFFGIDLSHPWWNLKQFPKVFWSLSERITISFQKFKNLIKSNITVWSIIQFKLSFHSWGLPQLCILQRARKAHLVSEFFNASLPMAAVVPSKTVEKRSAREKYFPIPPDLYS